jgi:diguanylate cyclase (GGDEF)-like protein
MNILWALEQWPRKAVVGLGIIVLSALFLIDSYTPPDQSFILFYLIPIFLVSWYAGRKPGVMMAIACAAAWIVSDEFSAAAASRLTVAYWNVLIKTLFLLAMAFHFSLMRRSYDREQKFARIDPLTGLANRRALFETLVREIARAKRYRHPVTVAYVDIDNFKAINDRWGHDRGDALLSYVGHVMATRFRAIDLVSRIGGDEFAIVAPETSPEQASKVMEHVHRLLNEGVQEREWDVSFSIGMITFLSPPASADEAIRRADELMYHVKKQSKNALSHKIIH